MKPLKPWVKYGGIAVGVIIIILACIPLFVHVDSFRPLIEQQLATALNRKVTFGHLGLSLFSGSVTADDLSIPDDPQFSQQPFLTAKSFHVGVQLIPLLFHHQILIDTLAIDAPNIHLVHAANGQWNFSSLGHPANPNAQPKDLPDFNVDKLTITNGHAVVENLPATGPPLQCDNVNLTIDELSLKKQFPITLTANLPAQGTVNLTGKAGPVNPKDTAHTNFDAQLTIHHLDPIAIGVLDPASGISLLGDVDAHLVSDGQTVTSNGTLHAQNLKLRPRAVPVPKPIDITYTVIHNLDANSGQLQDAAIQTGKIVAHITGTYALIPAPIKINLKVIAKGVPIDDLQAFLPAAGVQLPNGSVLHGGTVTTTLAVAGPINAFVISGPIEVSNTTLNGFNLSSQLKGIASAALGNTGNLTNFQTIRADTRVAANTVTATNIFISMPSLGECTGQGTVAPSGAIDFHLVMKVDTSRGIGAKATGMLTSLSAAGGAAGKQAAAVGVPVTITGTGSNPIITPDVNGLLKSSAAGAGKSVTNALGGLFGKKKN
jgi:AsmA protein